MSSDPAEVAISALNLVYLVVDRLKRAHPLCNKGRFPFSLLRVAADFAARVTALVLDALRAKDVIAGLEHDYLLGKGVAKAASMVCLEGIHYLHCGRHHLYSPGLVPVERTLVTVDDREVVLLSNLAQLALEEVVLGVELVQLFKLVVALAL